MWALGRDSGDQKKNIPNVLVMLGALGSRYGRLEWTCKRSRVAVTITIKNI